MPTVCEKERGRWWVRARMGQVSSDPPDSANAPDEQSTRGLGAGFRLVGRYVRLHPRPFTFAIAGSATFAVATVASSWVLSRLTDELIRPAFRGESVPALGVFSLFIAVGLLRVVSAITRRANAAFLRYDNLATWQRKVVRQLIDQPMSFFRRRPTGDLLAAAETDADSAVTVLSPLPYALGVIVLLVTASIWMLSIDWVIGLLALTLLPLLAFSNHVFERKTYEPVEQIQQDLAVLSGGVHELVDGFSAVKALGLEDQQRAKIGADINRVAASKLRALKIRVIFESVQELLLPTVNVGILLLGAYRVRAEALTVGEVAGVLGLFNLLVWPLRLLGFALAEVPRSLAGAARLDELSNEPVPEAFLPGTPHEDMHAYELRNVRLVHDDGRAALDGINLDIKVGTTVAIVGPTGCGKSTLLDVLAGLERPTSGELRVAPLKRSMVFQEPIVLSGSVADNLTLRLPVTDSALASGVSISEAAFLDALPHGRSTVIGERGITLSGGQRQRLALARAIARDPDVLLLDDTTSALDASTEERVLAALEEASQRRADGQKRTMVIVAARPSSISFADEIVVLQEGRVVAHGTHEELLETSDDYRMLYEALADSGAAV
jgi:ATP-binding cassette, subfamily B, bacterial